jgi:hypothetical protein
MTYLFDRLEEFREKFDHLIVHKKKILALDNLSQAVPFQHNDYLILIKKCVKHGFLSPEETSFLVYLVGKYFGDKNFLDWSHRTPWLKTEMRRLSRQTQKIMQVQQDLFNWSKLRDEHLVACTPSAPRQQARH